MIRKSMFINLGFFFFILRLDLVTQTSLCMGGCPSERLSFASPPMYWDCRLVPLCPTLFFCHFVLLFVFFLKTPRSCRLATLAGLVLGMQPRPALNSWQSSCLSLVSADITSVDHHISCAFLVI